eukprot:Rmarinus@m.3830
MTTRAVQLTRPHDTLYDPTYTVSAPRDHFRALQKAAVSSVDRVPVGENMFSELPHAPRFQFRLHESHHPPHFVSRAFRGSAGARAITRADLCGPERSKYFKRPVVPYVQALSADYVLDERRGHIAGQPQVQVAAEAAPEPPLKTVAIQTQYREQESQTDPFSPDYYVPAGKNPELLTLVSLSWGLGLPAGLPEVEMIERARAKRAFEASLPPLNDPAAFQLRRQMMEEQELAEWREREEEIEKIEAERLRIIKQAIFNRDQEKMRVNAENIEHVRQMRMAEKERKLADIQKRRIKILRKLTKKRAKAMSDPRQMRRRDIVRDYAQYSSKVYAPIMRDGISALQFSKPEVRPYLLSSYDGILELDDWMPPETMTAVIRKPKKTVIRDIRARKQAEHAKDLAFAQKLIDSRREAERTGIDATKLSQLPSPIREKYASVEIVERPPTPTVELEGGVDETEERRHAAAIFLQRLLRGRAVQEEMWRGKERRLELIRELRTVETLEGMQDELANDDAIHRLSLHREKLMHSTVQSLEGEMVSQSLDYLSKQLERLKQERRISAMVKLAERRRWMREAEEAGRRQEAERIRADEDRRFREVMSIHHETVDQFLDEVIGARVVATSKDQAKKGVRADPNVVNDIVDKIEERENNPETVVTDLVSAFLIPEVEKETLRRNVQYSQKKFAKAARDAIFLKNGLIEMCEETASGKKVAKEPQSKPKASVEPAAEAEGKSSEGNAEGAAGDVPPEDPTTGDGAGNKEEEPAVVADGEAEVVADGEAEVVADGEAEVVADGEA